MRKEGRREGRVGKEGRKVEKGKLKRKEGRKEG